VIRVVIDPGVYVSAFISPRRAAPGIVVEALLDGDIDVLISPLLLAELARVLGRTKFERATSDGRGAAFVALVAERGLRVEDPELTPGATEDPDDDYLVALAHAHHAEAIVSGDRHLLAVASDELSVWTPRMLVDHLEPTRQLGEG
jgi:putative PIN family toxin of toxin-antitoxin system